MTNVFFIILMPSYSDGQWHSNARSAQLGRNAGLESSAIKVNKWLAFFIGESGTANLLGQSGMVDLNHKQCARSAFRKTRCIGSPYMACFHVKKSENIFVLPRSEK